MTNATQFDDLYVVSDLHMGGRPGLQIMNRGDRLGRFIRQLAAQPAPESERRIGLVINGDVVDTLAEDFDGYIAASHAERMLQRLYDDEAFSPVWTALAAFVRQARRRLVFTIGNHDIELALPAVQHSIRRRLAGDDDAANGRIEFAVDGAGYMCYVGDARIFCTHGNEVDAWNVVDYDTLRRLVRDQNAGVVFNPAAWTPNAGTRLVRDVVNRVKRQRPWVELLKPERNVLLGVLLTIDPGVVRHVPALLPVAWQRGVGELRRRDLLSGTELGGTPATVAADPLALSDVMGPQLRRAIDGAEGSGGLRPEDGTGLSTDAMLLEIERHLAHGTTPARPLDDLDGTLGWPRMAFDRLRAMDAVEALRCALLDWHRDDHSFDLTDEDATFRSVSREVGPDVDVIVTGHTHLERAIVTPTRAYYNTGTWIRVIRFPDFALVDPLQFRAMYGLLDLATLADFDKAQLAATDGRTAPLVADVTTALQITATADGVFSWLGHVVDDAHDGARFERIPASEFRRK
jgi:UDP-2,3-diacylglucosamine pyrophosphatase LpxH